MDKLIQIHKQRSFSKESDYSAFATIRVHNNLVEYLGGRNTWVVLNSTHGKVYRTIRGHGSISPFPEDAVELDYETATMLAIHHSKPVKDTHSQNGSSHDSTGGTDGDILEKPGEHRVKERFYGCELTIRPANRFEIIRAHWHHPDPAYRVPLQISLALGGLSVVLGIIGIILGILSITGN